MVTCEILSCSKKCMGLKNRTVNKHTDTHVTMSTLKSTDYIKTSSAAVSWFCMQSDIIGHPWLYIHEAERHLADYDSFVCLSCSFPLSLLSSFKR